MQRPIEAKRTTCSSHRARGNACEDLALDEYLQNLQTSGKNNALLSLSKSTIQMSHYFNFLSLTPTKQILSVVFIQMKYQHAASDVTLLTVADVNLEPHSQQMNQYSFC